jgi:MFS family permease
MGFLASVPLFSGAVGGVLGGTLTDIVYRKTRSLKNARRLVCVISQLGCAVFLLPSAVAVRPAVVIWCMAGSVFFLALILGPAWAVSMDIGKEYSGSVSGVMNMMGNGIGAISPIVFGVLAQRGMWVAPFVVAAAVLVAGALMWGLLVNPEKSVVERPQAAVH